MKKWIIGIIASLTLLIIVSAACAAEDTIENGTTPENTPAASPASESTPTVEVEPTQGLEPTTTPEPTIELAEPTEEPTAEPTQPPANGNLSIGDSTDVGPLNVTIHGVQFSNGDEFYGPEQGKTWLLVDTEFRNISEEPQIIASFGMMELIDQNGVAQDPTIVTDAVGELDGSLQPGRNIRGEMAFIVDEGVSEWELIVQPNLFRQSEVVVYDIATE